MGIHFNRYRFRADAEALFMKAARCSRGFSRYAKGANMDRIIWGLKGWMMRGFADNREKRKEKRK